MPVLFHFPAADYLFHAARSMVLPAAGRAAAKLPPDRVASSRILANRDSGFDLSALSSLPRQRFASRGGYIFA
jgi:hypothetical protein